MASKSLVNKRKKSAYSSHRPKKTIKKSTHFSGLISIIGLLSIIIIFLIFWLFHQQTIISKPKFSPIYQKHNKKIIPIHHHYLHLANFKSFQQANSEQALLILAGYNIKLIKAKNQPYYKILIGPLSSSLEAQRLKEKLRKEYPHSKIVTD